MNAEMVFFHSYNCYTAVVSYYDYKIEKSIATAGNLYAQTTIGILILGVIDNYRLSINSYAS